MQDEIVTANPPLNAPVARPEERLGIEPVIRRQLVEAARMLIASLITATAFGWKWPSSENIGIWSS